MSYQKESQRSRPAAAEVRSLFPVNLVRDTAELYAQYSHVVYAYLLRLSGSPEVASDLLQESFIRAFRGAAGYRGESPPAAWLCAIARNLFSDYIRRAGRERAHRTEVIWEQLAAADEEPESAALRHEIRDRIEATMAALPEQQRMALLLRDADGLSYETIAEILGLSLANVKVTIHRARLRFRERYQADKE
ncbi:MAG: RNA polymerase sigma factor [Mycobacterium leprae]